MKKIQFVIGWWLSFGLFSILSLIFFPCVLWMAVVNFIPRREDGA